MLTALSDIKGASIEATDGPVGTVAEFLFDDETWNVRWVIADVGSWPAIRRRLLHPASVDYLDRTGHRLLFKLTKDQIEASPDVAQDQPFSRQMEARLFSYYQLDPSNYAGTSFGMGAMASPLVAPPLYSPDASEAMAAVQNDDDHKDDAHLRSITEVTGYHIHARDGDIGHVEDFVIEDSQWGIRFLVVDTRNWLPGRRVLVSPCSVRGIDWAERHITVDADRAQVKSSPLWQPGDDVDPATEKQLREHFGLPGIERGGAKK